MSIHDALAFIQKVAEDKKLQRKIQALGDEASLGDIARIGIKTGLVFSEEELRAAFVKDWAVRSAFYSRRNNM